MNPQRKRQANKIIEKASKEVESVMFVSYILSIDYLSINTIVGAILNLVHGYANRNEEILALLQSRISWFVPILNVDALEYLRGYFE